MGILEAESEIHRNYNSCPSARGILDLDTLSAVRLYNYNSRHSARNYFRQSNNISVSDITTLAHAGIEKTKSTKVLCDYNSRSSTRNSSVSRKRFEMPKRRCDYNSFQSYHERYWIAPENLPKHFLKSFVYYNARPSGAGLFLFFETYRSISLRRLYHTFPFLTNAFLENSAVGEFQISNFFRRILLNLYIFTF